MPDLQGSSPDSGPGLFDSLRSFWSVLLAILYTRFDLVTTELEDQATRVVKMLLSALISLLCFHCALFFAMFFIVVAFWYSGYVPYIIAAIFLIYAAAGTVGLVMARDLFLNRPKFLSQTLTELRRDVEGLNRTLNRKTDEVGK